MSGKHKEALNATHRMLESGHSILLVKDLISGFHTSRDGKARCKFCGSSRSQRYC